MKETVSLNDFKEHAKIKCLGSADTKAFISEKYLAKAY